MSQQSSLTAARGAALERLGAKGAHHNFPTTDVVIDPEHTVFIVSDPEPTDPDWRAVCALLTRCGYSNGTWPHSADPGEPDFDAQTGTCTWRLSLTGNRWPAGQPTGPELN
jgi:hypothetical protein